MGSATELAKVISTEIDEVPVGTTNEEAPIGAAMIVIADTKLAAGYTPSWETGKAYVPGVGGGAWSRKLRVTNDTIPLDFTIDAEERAITVTIAEA
jgi:hypothetical protein